MPASLERPRARRVGGQLSEYFGQSCSSPMAGCSDTTSGADEAGLTPSFSRNHDYFEELFCFTCGESGKEYSPGRSYVAGKDVRDIAVFIEIKLFWYGAKAAVHDVDPHIRNLGLGGYRIETCKPVDELLSFIYIQDIEQCVVGTVITSRKSYYITTTLSPPHPSLDVVVG